MWERYKPQILATALVIFLLSVLSIYLALETHRRKRAEALTAATLRFEQIISELSTYFIELSADRIDSGITHALDRLVEVLGVDRITVFKFNSAETELEALYFSTMSRTPAPSQNVVRPRVRMVFFDAAKSRRRGAEPAQRSAQPRHETSI